jgi:DNA-binding transcriptional MocR family regulator
MITIVSIAFALDFSSRFCMDNTSWHHLKTLFPTDSQQDFISFEYGAPDRSLLPTDLFNSSSDLVDWCQLQYGSMRGDSDFLDQLSSFLTNEYHSPVSKNCLCTTTGCSQSFWNLLHWFSCSDTIVLLEEPTYFLACKIIKESGLKSIGIEGNERGFDVDSLERILSLNRREKLNAIEEFGFLLYYTWFLLLRTPQV